MSSALVVSIGTTHPWNIAGVGLDARVVAEYGLTHAMAIAAVSAQDDRGLRALHVVAPDVVRAQLECLPREAAAYRIGALVASENVRIVAAFLRKRAREVPIIVDPVLAVTLGGDLRADDAYVPALRNELLRLPVIVTPNVPEAEQLLDLQVDTVEAMRAAARTLVERGARAAIVKGGHLAGEPIDVLVDRGDEQVYTGERIAGSMRGSGCTFAAALACELALGSDLASAVPSARAYVRAKIAAHTVRNGLQVAF